MRPRAMPPLLNLAPMGVLSPPPSRLLRDSDMWAVYSRVCVRQALAVSARAALTDDADLEAVTEHTQPARPAPRRTFARGRAR